ncbi:sigma-54 interaction domain-containing protein [Rhodospirillum sp. A1_3_36]|uniref:sigma-54 interaction domain-containing protein n=1 Tax=Rhodospirillum sp. A1_3_36 TaxID=3391666 RepID=UPI0039A73313
MNEQDVRRQAAKSLSALFDTLYEGAFAVDLSGRVTWMNHKFKALIGWNGAEPVEGQPIEEVLPKSRMHRVLETGQADLLDLVPLGRHQLTVSRLPLHDDSGTLAGAMGVILYDRLHSLKPLVDRFQTLQEDLERARQDLARSRAAKYSLATFVGGAEGVRALKRRARQAADREAPVLITGETGVGKELLAHGIHAASGRAAKPMVRINVSAIPEGLLEGELFGAAPGAYTGADRKGREGKVKLADGGTLFLDEIGDMPLALQTKLLRVLQEQEIEPLGANRVIPVNVRVISATSRDLPAMVADGSFRADLFYRLNVLPLHAPALRDRLEDLPLLCDALLEGMAERDGGVPRSVTEEGLCRLADHDWPGNVRELRNVLEQAVAAAEDDHLGPEMFDALLPPPKRKRSAPVPPSAVGEEGRIRPLRDLLAETEAAAIRAALEATGGNRGQAAKALGISRSQFYEKLASMEGAEPPVRKAGQTQ